MLIERQEYMEKLIAFRDMQIIKVVTGVRRCGKSRHCFPDGYVQIEMLPLSFREFVSTTGSEDDLPGKYKKYLENSSFPYTLAFEGRQKEIRDYLQGAFNTIIVKDILNRWKISDPFMLESALRYIFDTLSTKKSRIQ